MPPKSKPSQRIKSPGGVHPEMPWPRGRQIVTPPQSPEARQRIANIAADIKAQEVVLARRKILKRVAVIFLVVAGVGFALAYASQAAQARGFDWFFANIKPTGKCPGREIAVSYYSSGRHTASGEAFNANGNTAASRTLPFGTVVSLTNPHNGRTVNVRINDRGPYGPAHRLGVKLDIARGAAQRLGMTQTGWVCAS